MTRERDYINCVECKSPLDPDHPRTLRRIVAWERKSVAGSRRSGSDVMLREHRDEFMCMGCAERIKRGLAPLQTELLLEAA